MMEQPNGPTSEQQAFARLVVEGNAAIVQGITNLSTALEPLVDALHRDMANMAHAIRVADQEMQQRRMTR